MISCFSVDYYKKMQYIRRMDTKKKTREDTAWIGFGQLVVLVLLFYIKRFVRDNLFLQKKKCGGFRLFPLLRTIGRCL